MKSVVNVESTVGFMKAMPLLLVAGPTSSLPSRACQRIVACWFIDHCRSTGPSVGGVLLNVARPTVHNAAGSPGSIGAGVGLLAGVPAVEHLVTLNFPEWLAGAEDEPRKIS